MMLSHDQGLSNTLVYDISYDQSLGPVLVFDVSHDQALGHDLAHEETNYKMLMTDRNKHRHRINILSGPALRAAPAKILYLAI